MAEGALQVETPPPPEFRLFIGGEWVAGEAVVAIRSPYDGQVAGLAHRAGAAHLEQAMHSAAQAFALTSRLPTYQRAAILEGVVAGLKTDREGLAQLIAREAGKPLKYARAEVGRAILTFTDAVEEAKRLRGEWLPLDLDAASEGRQGLVRRFPVGPVAAITPFNFPLNLVAHKVAPALACGSPIVLKPASQTPLTALRLAEIVQNAGAPPGSFHVVHCPGAMAETLATDPRMKYLSFTGSGGVGWRLRDLAGHKKVALELGGNAGVAVHADADLDYAAQRCAMGGFAYAGQTCISVQRIFVHRPVFDAFLEKFIACTRRLKVGDPLDEQTDVGPMISEAEAQRAWAWVEEAVREGAEMALGEQPRGTLMPPVILIRTTPAMKVNCQEIFAPVVTVGPYADWAEALRLINDSPYGLQAGIFTRDMPAIHQAFETLEVGGLLVNDVPTWRADVMPYGGWKESGLGREGVRYALEGMTERRIMVWKA
ncbi:MAG: aldehyde dehydrogenase family protein [Verrucomicrobiae bacterium]|nr:aldehyde dehydrogenase family protein [Verrucomicrobiae bacterium]